MQIAALVLHLHQMGDDLVEQSLPLMGGGHRKAVQCVAKAASGADDVAVLVKHGTGVIQMTVAGDAFGSQKFVDFLRRNCMPSQGYSPRRMARSNCPSAI